MPDQWFQNPGHPLPWHDITLRLVVATITGCLVALIHHYTRSPDDNGKEPTRGFFATLILLSLLLAMVIITVGNNIASAFSLAGVMAIVRFRTVVESTRDSAFVICAVVVGMACGAGWFDVTALGLPLVALVAWLTRHSTQNTVASLSTLKVRIGLAPEHTARLDEQIQLYTQTARLIESSTAKQGSLLELVYQVRLKPGTQPLEMIRDLNRAEGIQEAEWKQEK